MSKLSRQFMEFVYAAIGASRAEDIPYDGSQSIKTKIDSIGLGNVPGLAPGRASQWGMLQVSLGPAPTGMEEFGLCTNSVYSDTSSVNSQEAGHGVAFHQTGGTPQLVGTAPAIRLRSYHNPILIGKIKVDHASLQPFVFGFTNITGQAYMTNNPAGSYCMLQYRPSRDTNFQLMTKDGVTQNLVDTGVAVVVNTVYYVALDFDSANTLATLSIYDSTYTLLASVTSAVNLPIPALDIRWELQSTNNLYTFFLHLVTRIA